MKKGFDHIGNYDKVPITPSLVLSTNLLSLFETYGNIMKIENIEVKNIVKDYGTPVYVYSLAKLRRSIEEIKSLAPVIRYAMKACSNRTILGEMKTQGVMIDAVSVFEVVLLGTPGESGSPSVATPEPALTRNMSAWP